MAHVGRPGDYDGMEDRAGFSEDETEFVMAMERYRRERRRPFPSFREVLAVAKSLGYRKVEAATELPKKFSKGQ